MFAVFFVGLSMTFVQLWSGCSSPEEVVAFSQVYQGVIKGSCAFTSCHGGGAGGLNLKEENAYDNLVGKDANGIQGEKLVVAGAPSQSVLFKILKGKIGNVRRMPPTDALSQDKIDMVEKWIKQGAKKE